MSPGKLVRRLALASVASLAAVLTVGIAPAYADNGPHQSMAINSAQAGITLDQMGVERCASCHRAHTGQSPYLLVAASQADLCYTCHGDGGTGATTNVQSGVGYGGAGVMNTTTGNWVSANSDGTITGALRGGGFDNARIGASEATKDIYQNGTRWSARNQTIPALSTSEKSTSSHLGGSNTMWGKGALTGTANPGEVLTSSTRLACGSCHDPHGNNQYRILKPVPDGAVTGVAAITIQDTVNKVYTTNNYWTFGDPAATDTLTKQYLGATSTVNPTPIVKNLSATSAGVSSYAANVSAWCTQCHTRYLAPSGSWQNSSGDAIFTYRHTGDNVSAEANGRNCAQCHVAHGSNAAMSVASEVEYPGGTTKSADSRLLRVDDRGMCLMCHNV